MRMYFSTLGQIALELGEDPRDRLVDEDDAVLGVVDDVDGAARAAAGC